MSRVWKSILVTVLMTASHLYQPTRCPPLTSSDSDARWKKYCGCPNPSDTRGQTRQGDAIQGSFSGALNYPQRWPNLVWVLLCVHCPTWQIQKYITQAGLMGTTWQVQKYKLQAGSVYGLMCIQQIQNYKIQHSLVYMLLCFQPGKYKNTKLQKYKIRTTVC